MQLNESNWIMKGVNEVPEERIQLLEEETKFEPSLKSAYCVATYNAEEESEAAIAVVSNAESSIDLDSSLGRITREMKHLSR